MNVDVGDGLAGGDAVVLEDVEAVGVEGGANGDRDVAGVAVERVDFVVGQVEQRGGVADRADEEGAVAVLAGVDEGGDEVVAVDEGAGVVAGEVAAERAGGAVGYGDGHVEACRQGKARERPEFRKIATDRTGLAMGWFRPVESGLVTYSVWRLPVVNEVAGAGEPNGVHYEDQTMPAV